MESFIVSQGQVSIRELYELVRSRRPLELDHESEQLIIKCRRYLDEALPGRDRPIYGVNTGFGSLCKVVIPDAELEQLQHNLIVSHACGTGAILDPDLTRLMMVLKIISLSKGHSGVRLETVQRLIDMYNADVLPVVFEQGSLGASGDLCPLAHLSLPLIGKGEVVYKETLRNTDDVLKENSWEPLHLGSKEGLALLNGTQFMSAHAVWCLAEADRLAESADLVSALSLDAWDCRAEPFFPHIHHLRHQQGQIKVAENIRRILHDSAIFSKEKEQVQDPYSFRCIPQVHGASRDAIAYCMDIVTREINGVTDNPNIFPDDDLILSGGNFHGQPLALSLDFLAIAMSELASISERRVYRMLSGARDLPEFLVAGGGLHSGLMIPQYTAASLVSQNKQLCTPSSVDSIPSCNEQEDHVSMGANAATKCLRVLDNCWQVLGIEWLTAAQALEFRRPQHTSQLLEKNLSLFRMEVEALPADRYLHPDLVKARDFLVNQIEYV